MIYGILGVSTGFSDAGGGLSGPEALTCVYDIYNEWAADFCKASPERLAALACISSHSRRQLGTAQEGRGTWVEGR